MKLHPIALAERQLLPDFLIRIGIRRLLRQRLRDMQRSPEGTAADFAATLRHGPLAVETQAANEQHYEVPAEFFEQVLGPRLKYSCALFSSDTCSLAEAEEAMLEQTCHRADLVDGQTVLELGCGWGSLTLWMAENYPQSTITAVSNSNSQRRFIEQKAESLGLHNLRVLTADMREFETDFRFDRVLSVEMFEHMRNYDLLLRKVSEWLADDGKAFVHIFCHRQTPYLFETEGESNWMGRHFFTGGMMPSEELFHEFQDHLVVEEQHRVNGKHYWRTSENWLRNLDQKIEAIEAIFAKQLSKTDAKIAVQRWRIFFMACAELFRFDEGNEWYVGHYRFCHSSKPSDSALLPAAST